MNFIDLVILVAFGYAIYSGYRRGVILQVFSWGGFLIGLAFGGLVGPPIVHAINPKSALAKAIVGLVAFLGIAFIIEALIAFAGAKLARKLTAERIKKADRIIGSIVAGVMALATFWVLSLPARRVAALSPTIKKSVILRAEYAMFNNPPDIFAAVGSFLSHTGFPEVFAELNPSLAPDVKPPPESLKNNAAIKSAANLTFKIESTGCEGRVVGSGFPAEPDVLITAAHVVAGTHNTVAFIAGDATPYPATVVYMDPDTDIAVLRAPALPDRKLTVDPNPAARETDGAAIGYPGGGPRTISVARVRARVNAQGFDIHNRHRVTRSIYVLRAEVHQGNSGGPFVDTKGKVRGMIFAASAQKKDESYALTEEEIMRALRMASGRSRQVDTGTCAI